MLTGKTFILGVGAQRAGTTWLSYYLRQRRDVFISPIKELHFFDQKFRPDLCGNCGQRFARQLIRMAGTEEITPEMLKKPRIRRLYDRVSMNEDDSAYPRFFEQRIKGHESALGEITPSYSLIGSDGFAFAKSLLEKKGLKIKVIFLMRDPVDRYYSALRRKERNQKNFSAYKNFSRLLFEPALHERTRYDRTCRNLLAVFDSRDIFFGFYETLFSPETIAELCNFLGLEHKPANFDVMKNASATRKVLDEDMAVQASEAFAPVYDYCRATFGKRVPSSWR